MSGLLWFERYGDIVFPDLKELAIQADGLFAAGGNLSTQSLLNAYQSGCFPWFNEDQPILWWCPDPRLVLEPQHLHIGKSLKKHLRKNCYQLKINHNFADVIAACASERHEGTWISQQMQLAYHKLHQLGFAHSVELYCDEQLVGGLYGVSLGKVFFGESMFSRRSNASKVAFTAFVIYLQQQGIELIDCQVETDYLRSFGADNISRANFLERLSQLSSSISPLGQQTKWHCTDVGKYIDENS